MGYWKPKQKSPSMRIINRARTAIVVFKAAIIYFWTLCPEVFLKLNWHYFDT